MERNIHIEMPEVMDVCTAHFNMGRKIGMVQDNRLAHDVRTEKPFTRKKKQSPPLRMEKQAPFTRLLTDVGVIQGFFYVGHPLLFSFPQSQS